VRIESPVSPDIRFKISGFVLIDLPAGAETGEPASGRTDAFTFIRSTKNSRLRPFLNVGRRRSRNGVDTQRPMPDNGSGHPLFGRKNERGPGDPTRMNSPAPRKQRRFSIAGWRQVPPSKDRDRKRGWSTPADHSDSVITIARLGGNGGCARRRPPVSWTRFLGPEFSSPMWRQTGRPRTVVDSVNAAPQRGARFARVRKSVVRRGRTFLARGGTTITQHHSGVCSWHPGPALDIPRP